MNKKISVREQIKLMLLWKDISLSRLVRKLNIIHNTNFSHSNLSQKLLKGTIKFEEVVEIADLLGYNVVFKERENWEDWEEK